MYLFNLREYRTEEMKSNRIEAGKHTTGAKKRRDLFLPHTNTMDHEVCGGVGNRVPVLKRKVRKPNIYTHHSKVSFFRYIFSYVNPETVDWVDKPKIGNNSFALNTVRNKRSRS